MPKVRQQKMKDAALKRAFDVIVASVGLLVLSPVLIVVASAVRLSSAGNAVYKAPRIGKEGRLFYMYKFRSMVVDADVRGESVTTSQDCRITALGRVLRKTKVDELPELFNVLKGDMTIVGPRPESPDWVALYDCAQRGILAVRPGITDPAQVLFRHEEDFLRSITHYHALMNEKVRLQMEYQQRRSFLSDLVVLSDTFRALFEREPRLEALEVYRRISSGYGDPAGVFEEPTQVSGRVSIGAKAETN